MSPVFGSYSYESVFSISGVYDYYIWAIDNAGNINTSEIYTFTMKEPEGGWYIISIPVSNPVLKADLIIEYNGSSYSWDDAVTGGLIDYSVFGWDRSMQCYGTMNSLDGGFGYWLFTYRDGINILPPTMKREETITTLSSGWNMVGLPMNQSVNLTDIIVEYNGSDYTWSNATSVVNDILDASVWGWDRLDQQYVLADSLIPLYGYWIFSNKQCTLKRS
jgi:hypothetical protein